MPGIRAPSGPSVKEPNQYSQPSRKGKKAWRKNVDVTEVRDGLQELNEEVIRGGVIKEKDSADLFAIDIKGDSRNSQKFPKHIKKGLKADEIIAQRSAVPAVSMRKRPGDKTTNGVTPTKRRRTDWVSHKELSRLKKVADGERGSTIETKDATYDLWDLPADQPAEENSNQVAAHSKVKAPKSSKQQPISLLANGKQASAVAKPTGGYSYNPLFDDYEARLAEESQKALAAERKRLDDEQAELQRKEAAARSAAEAEAAEARANLSEWEDDSEWEGFQSGAEDDRPNVKRPQRKTQAQRNKIKRRKEEERLAKHKAAMKARNVQEQRIKEIALEVAEREQNRELALAAEREFPRDGEGADDDDIETGADRLRRRQLGKMKLPERDLELVLPDELQESLRLLKPEGNLLKDRYRSMLVRGKVESRRHLPFKRQARKKVTEKWTHKDFVL